MSNSNKPMINSEISMDIKYTEDELNDLDLSNPYSKMSCLILYLYSMELGSPPLYYEINRVCRMKDMS